MSDDHPAAESGDPPVKMQVEESNAKMETMEKVKQDEVAENEKNVATAPAGAERKEEPSASEPVVKDSKAEGTSAANTPAWDHSDRRVMLQGVHKYYDVKTVRKMVEEFVLDVNKEDGVHVEIDKVKKPPKQSWMTITLMKIEMVQPFIDYVNSRSLKSKSGDKLFAKRVDANDKNSRKRKTENDPEERGGKRPDLHVLKSEARRPVTEEEIKDKVCPLWKLTEQEQLDQKIKEMIRKSALKIIAEIKSKFRSLEREQRRKIPYYDWFKEKRSIEVKDVIPVPSPVRNKVEFTFGYRYLFDESPGNQLNDSEPPKVPAVGFMILGWAGGVSRPHCCPNIGPEFCAVSDLVDEFLKDSPLPPYDSSSHTGFWRILTIRASRRTRECMVVITHSPSSGGKGQAVEWSTHVEKEKERLLELLKSAELPVPDQDPIRITSIYFQEFDGLSAPKPDDPVQLAYGKPTIEERLGKCTFHISPGAFFQVNTAGAEVLFQRVVEKVKEVSNDPKNTLLFDVCCGTGTIGLTCMREGAVGKVVGVDISEPAIEDAKKNAKANGFKNNDDDGDGESTTRFVASRAEHVMGKEITKAKKAGTNFVAVVDPAREGLHADVVRALRANEEIGRIVYVSCNPTGSLIKDAALLCCPPTKKYRGRPFCVESAQPVDMFPLTSHCEMVMTFDRLTETNAKVEITSSSKAE